MDFGVSRGSAFSKCETTSTERYRGPTRDFSIRAGTNLCGTAKTKA